MGDFRLDRRSLIAAGIGAGLAAPYVARAQATGEAPVADTQYGKIRGSSSGVVKVFKGVPYGANTGGANRFLPPKPPAAWTGVKDTLAYSEMCPQTFGAPMPEETAMLQKGPMGEDCLKLNVWTPAIGPNSGKRPVIVWFHGGGFNAGSGAATSYDGVNLASKHDVVLVTSNHRLNIFGYLNLANLYGDRYIDSGNAGILDCVAVLRWVRDNIANFGGDPGLVTIAGQSGGAGKVSTLMAIPQAKGLFHRAIAESGAAIRSGTVQASSRSARNVNDYLGAWHVDDLQNAPAAKLIEAMGGGRFQAGPIVDGRTLLDNPFDPSAPLVSADVPFMTGATETESQFGGAPRDLIDDARLLTLVKQNTRADDAKAQKLIADARGIHPGIDNTYLYQLISSVGTSNTVAIQAERKAALTRAPAYVYYFKKHVPGLDGKLRAPHTAEIPFALDNIANAKPLVGDPTPALQAVADKVSASWVAFARTGNPTVKGLPVWEPYIPATRKVMVIDDVFTLQNDPLRPMRLAVQAASPPAAA